MRRGKPLARAHAAKSPGSGGIDPALAAHVSLRSIDRPTAIRSPWSPRSGKGSKVCMAARNSWIIINVGGGPTDDKPAVTLETPRDPDRVSSFLNIRVADIHAVYAEWSARGAQFLTPPKQHEYEIRCYLRDPDGYLIEVGQTTDPDMDWSPAHWPSSTP